MNNKIPDVTTAIDLIVEEVSSFVDDYRNRYCSSVHGQMPPHITLLFPFKHPDQITPQEIEKLQTYFSGIDPIDYKLDKVDYFNKVAYLAPDPMSPFINIMKGLMELSPKSRPYGCDFKDPPPPHLTFAKSNCSDELKKIGTQFYADHKKKLAQPLKFTKAHLTFVENGKSIPTIEFFLRNSISE